MTVPFPQKDLSASRISAQTTANEIVERWKNIPSFKEALFKVIYLAGEPISSQKGEGLVWKDSKNYLRINRGSPSSEYPYQQIDHVIVRHHNKVRGRNGQVITKSPAVPNPKQTPDAHIPLTEWLKWESWFEPKKTILSVFYEPEPFVSVEKLELVPVSSPLTTYTETISPSPFKWRLEEDINFDVQLHVTLTTRRFETMVLDKMVTKLEERGPFTGADLNLKRAKHSDGKGLSWSTKDKAHYFCFRMGESESSYPFLQGSHVKILMYGRVVNKQGNFHKEEELAANQPIAEDCHVPFNSWLMWPLWFAPKLPVDVKAMQARWAEEQKLKLQAAQQGSATVESFPAHSTPPVPLITPLPTEDKKGIIEAFPQAELSKASISATPIHPQGRVEEKGFQQYDGPLSSILFNEQLSDELFQLFVDKDLRKKFNIPDDWNKVSSDKQKGIKFIAPEHPDYNEVRIMKGRPDSDFPAQRIDYVKLKKEGHYLDKNGSIVNKGSVEAHIPLEEFKLNIGELWKTK